MSPKSNHKNSIFALSLFSLFLSTAMTGTASHVLHSYNSQQATNAWWLPIWPSHFDARGLKTLIGGSISLVVLNSLTCGSVFIKAPYARFSILAFAAVSAVAAVVEVAYPAVINNAAPGTDSMQTWTCQWESAHGSPGDFSALCYESRFAYFATIPVLVTQLLVLSLAVHNLFVSRWETRIHEEKGEELGSIIKPESLRGGFGHDGASGKGSPEMHVRSSP